MSCQALPLIIHLYFDAGNEALLRKIRTDESKLERDHQQQKAEHEAALKEMDTCSCLFVAAVVVVAGVDGAAGGWWVVLLLQPLLLLQWCCCAVGTFRYFLLFVGLFATVENIVLELVPGYWEHMRCCRSHVFDHRQLHNFS